MNTHFYFALQASSGHQELLRHQAEAHRVACRAAGERRPRGRRTA